MMPIPWVIIAALIAVAGAYFAGRNDGAELQEAQEMREDRIALVARDAAQRGAARAIADIVVVNRTINNRLEREIREQTVYRDCVHSPDGLRLINAALAGRSEPPDDRQLPVADPAGGH